MIGGDFMKDNREIREAIEACDRVLYDIEKALDYLSSASNWALFDILGGEFISSLAKRSKIKKANSQIASLKPSLNHLQKELSDIGMDLPAEISDTFKDNFFDLYFDNIFTDLRVRGEIKEKVFELENLSDKVSYIRDSLRDLY